MKPNLADGYLEPVWRKVNELAVPMTLEAHPVLGPHGECWLNAWLVARTDQERFVYVEGLAVSAKGRIGPGWVITPRLVYPHAWVYDRRRKTGLECTAGWPRATDALYRGVPVRHDRAARLFEPMLADLIPFCSYLELSTLQRKSA